jgi:hypothetical protein
MIIVDRKREVEGDVEDTASCNQSTRSCVETNALLGCIGNSSYTEKRLRRVSVKGRSDGHEHPRAQAVSSMRKGEIEGIRGRGKNQS